MDKKYWENKSITVYWWNYSKKTLDFQGTYKEFLKKKDIKVRQNKGTNGYKFTFDIGSSRVVYDIYSVTDYFKVCDEVIKLFLTLIGDKSKLITERNEYKINWN